MRKNGQKEITFLTVILSREIEGEVLTYKDILLQEAIEDYLR